MLENNVGIAGPWIERVFEGRAEESGQTVEEVREATKSFSGQLLPIDNDMQQAC